MATLKSYRSPGSTVRYIALANLVDATDSGYKYVATRIYDVETDTISDTVLSSKGQLRGMARKEIHYAMWPEVPTLNVKTKRIVGKNKDKYCTLIAVRVFRLTRAMIGQPGVVMCQFPPLTPRQKERDCGAVVPVHVLGYTFMDVNGDKVYKTVAELRKEDMFQHAHSIGDYADAEVRKRKIMLCKSTYGYIEPMIEESSVDASLEDAEITQARFASALTGGWYTMDADGTLRVDKDAIGRQQLDVLEVPEGVLHIPGNSFANLDSVRRIKLPESLLTIAPYAIHSLKHLEDINIPSKVKVLCRVFAGCKELNTLDFSNIERLTGFKDVVVEYLKLPDVLLENTDIGEVITRVIKFRNNTNAKQRVIKTTIRDPYCSESIWQAESVETDGPVVLGDYGVTIFCEDAEALEENIVGIEYFSFFGKWTENANGKYENRPWLLGADVAFAYGVFPSAYQFTEEALKANKLRAVALDADVDTALPESVEVLLGELGKSMLKANYPNVVYTSHSLCKGAASGVSVEAKMPRLQWVMPKAGPPKWKRYDEAQIKRLEKKLTPKLPEVCKRTQEVFKLDLTQAENLAQLKRRLLCASTVSVEAGILFKEYGMIYVGDYNEVLRGK